MAPRRWPALSVRPGLSAAPAVLPPPWGAGPCGQGGRCGREQCWAGGRGGFWQRQEGPVFRWREKEEPRGRPGGSPHRSPAGRCEPRPLQVPGTVGAPRSLWTEASGAQSCGRGGAGWGVSRRTRRPQGRRAAGQVAGTQHRGRPREGLCKRRSSEADRRGGRGPRVGGIAHRHPGAWPEERVRARSSSSPCPCEEGRGGEGRGGEGRGGKGGRKGAGSGPGVRAEGPASGRGWKRQCWHGEGGAIGTRVGGRVAGRAV